MADRSDAWSRRGSGRPGSPPGGTSDGETVVRIEIYAGGQAVDVRAPQAVVAPAHAPSPTLAAVPPLTTTAGLPLTPVPAQDAVTEVTSSDMRRRERRVRQSESELRDRVRELNERETAVDVREAELEVAFGLREERIERREAELAEREDRLRRKETDLARYVGQVQAQFARAG